MEKRVSLTLAICALAGAIAVVGLLRPGFATTPAREAAVAEAGHGGGHGGDGTEAVAPADPGTVTIQSFAFSGLTTARPGDVITVTNLDSAPHTLTASNGAFDTGTLGAGESVSLTLPTDPGTYEIFCQIHPSMVSAITIQP